MIEHSLDKAAASGQVSKDQIHIILNILQTVLQFDPDIPTYSKEEVAKLNDYKKQKASDLGVTLYELTNKKYYSKYRQEKMSKHSLKCN